MVHAMFWHLCVWGWKDQDTQQAATWHIPGGTPPTQGKVTQVHVPKFLHFPVPVKCFIFFISLQEFIFAKLATLHMQHLSHVATSNI